MRDGMIVVFPEDVEEKIRKINQMREEPLEIHHHPRLFPALVLAVMGIAFLVILFLAFC